jgi:hypothetical protein
MTIFNGISCSVVGITVSALTFGALLKTSKTVLTSENQDKALKIANIVVLTTGLLGFYYGHNNKFFLKN